MQVSWTFYILKIKTPHLKKRPVSYVAFLNCSHFQLLHIIKMGVAYVVIKCDPVFPLIKLDSHRPVVPGSYCTGTCIFYDMFDLPSWAMLLPSSNDLASESFFWQSWGKETFLPNVPHVVSEVLKFAERASVHFDSAKVFTTSENWRSTLRISPLRLRSTQEALCNFPDQPEAKGDQQRE